MSVSRGYRYRLIRRNIRNYQNEIFGNRDEQDNRNIRPLDNEEGM